MLNPHNWLIIRVMRVTSQAAYSIGFTIAYDDFSDRAEELVCVF